MTANVIPVTKAIYLCDDVLEDPTSRKTHLLGLFNAIRPATGYPYGLRQLCVFAQFVEGLGEITARVEIIDARRDEVVFTTAEHRLHFPGRQTLVSACFRIRDCTFAEPGVFFVELYCDNTFVDDRVLHLLAEEAAP